MRAKVRPKQPLAGVSDITSPAQPTHPVPKFSGHFLQSPAGPSCGGRSRGRGPRSSTNPSAIPVQRPPRRLWQETKPGPRSSGRGVTRGGAVAHCGSARQAWQRMITNEMAEKKIMTVRQSWETDQSLWIQCISREPGNSVSSSCYDSMRVVTRPSPVRTRSSCPSDSCRRPRGLRRLRAALPPVRHPTGSLRARRADAASRGRAAPPLCDSSSAVGADDCPAASKPALLGLGELRLPPPRRRASCGSAQGLLELRLRDPASAPP